MKRMFKYIFLLLGWVLPLALLADRWRPLVLLILVLSWLPSAVAPALLLHDGAEIELVGPDGWRSMKLNDLFIGYSRQ